LTFEIDQAGMSSTYHYRQDHPGIFRCKDFALQKCCEDCHAKGHVIAIYPWSNLVKAPDLSLGLRAEVCCGLFHFVRELPRAWWINRYGEKSGWSAADCKRLVDAPAESYYKTVREIAARYFVGGGGIQTRAYSGGVSKPRPASRPAKRGCPECGSAWDHIACDNCGYSEGDDE
jgi:hypothetical protein